MPAAGESPLLSACLDVPCRRSFASRRRSGVRGCRAVDPQAARLVDPHEPPTGGVRHSRRPAPLHSTGTALATMGVAAEGDAALGVSGAALASAGCLLGDDCAMAEYELIDSVK